MTDLLISLSDPNAPLLPQWGIYAYQEGINDRCICGRRITKAFTVKNNLNGNEVKVGSGCIDLFDRPYFPQKANTF